MLKLRKLRTQFGCWLLGIPKGTKGVCLPGRIVFPPGTTSIQFQDFYFIAFDPKVIALQVDSRRGVIDVFQGE